MIYRGNVKLPSQHYFGHVYMLQDIMYAIKIYITERNDVTERHHIVIITWRTSAIEVIALSKTLA